MSNDIFVLCLNLQRANKKIKSPSANAKGLEMSWLPLLDAFRTFCCGEIIEELRKIYKPKDLTSLPVSVTNSFNCLFSQFYL
jgi:hypothetical protein